MPRLPKFVSPLRFVRQAVGMTQSDFAQAIGVSASHLQDVELGTRRVTDRIARRVGLRWDIDPASLKKSRGSPNLADGSAITKPARHPDVRSYFRTFEQVRWPQLNAAVEGVLNEQVIDRLRQLFATAISLGRGPMLYADVGSWLAEIEGQFPKQGREDRDSVEDKTRASADSAKAELELAFLPDPLQEQLFREMKRKISRSKSVRLKRQ